jgi:ribonuclease HI
VGWIVHVDGAARGNPGPAGAGVVIRSDDGTLLHEGGYFLGRQTNNAAEYHALIRSLQRVGRIRAQTVMVCSDSELMVRQVTGEYRVKSPQLARLFEQAQLLLLRIPCWNIRHIPREENRRADELANLAIDQQRDVIVHDVDGTNRGPAFPAVDAPSAERPETAPARSPAESTSAEEQAAPPQTVHAVRVTLHRAPKPGGCVAGQCSCEAFTVESTLPAGLCIHAAHALLPTIIAILNTEPAEFSAVPTLTVRCMRPECGAAFHVAPVRSSNGASKRDHRA